MDFSTEDELDIIDMTNLIEENLSESQHGTNTVQEEQTTLNTATSSLGIKHPGELIEITPRPAMDEGIDQQKRSLLKRRAVTPPTDTNSGRSEKDPLDFDSSDLGRFFSPSKDSAGRDILVCRLVPTQPDGKESSDKKPCGTSLLKQPKTFSNLRRHLKMKHGINVESLSGRQPKLLSSVPAVTLSVPAFMENNEKYTSNHPKQQRFDRTIVDLIAVDGRPANVVSGSGFQCLVLGLDRRITVKTRQAYTKQMIDIATKEIMPELKKCMASLPKRNCHFSCDIWSTRRREGVLGIIAHWISKDWKLQSRVIAFIKLVERHTASHINEKFLECLRDIEFPPKWGGVVVTDNASNMTKCFNLLSIVEDNTGFEPRLDTDLETEFRPEEEVYVWEEDDVTEGGDESDHDIEIINLVPAESEILGHLGCISHTLQLGINDSIKQDEEAKSFINYINNIMMFFKRSILCSDELRKLTKVDVIIPAKTRWNATLDMIGRFQNEEFFNAVRKVLDKATEEFRPSKPSTVKQKKGPPRSPVNFERLKSRDLYKILRPAGDATDQLQSEDTTANLVLLSIMNTYNRLKDIRVDNFESLRKTLLKQFQKRMLQVIKTDEYFIAALLDPRLKGQLFAVPWEWEAEIVPPGDNAVLELEVFTLPSKEEVQKKLRILWANEKKEMNEGVCNEGGEELQLQTVSSNSQPQHSNTLFSIMAKAIPEEIEQPIDELELYFKESVSKESVKPLEYWAVNETNYPVLSRLAARYLAIPATSAGIERVFSVAGAIASARRAKSSINTMCLRLMIRQERKPIVEEKIKLERDRKKNAEKIFYR